MAARDRETLRPSFDMRDYARRCETSSPRVTGETPSSVEPSLASTRFGLELLDLPENVFFARLDERVRRAELLLAMLKGGGLSSDIAARALQAQLEAIRRGALDLGARELVALLEVLVSAVGELAKLPRGTGWSGVRDVLVLDETEVARDLVALAVESQGHVVRCAGDFEEFVALFGERSPDLVLSDIELTNAPARIFCRSLRDVVGSVPIIFFATRGGKDVEEGIDGADAARVIDKQAGVVPLLAAIATIFEAKHDSR